MLKKTHSKTAGEMMRKLLPNLSGIFDLTYHLDLVSKILQREQMKHIKLTGMDLFTSIEPYIKDNTIDAIIFQNLEAQTYLACKLLFEQFCYGKEIKKDKYYSKLQIFYTTIYRIRRQHFLHFTLIISHVFFRMSVHPYQYTNTDND